MSHEVTAMYGTTQRFTLEFTTGNDAFGGGDVSARAVATTAILRRIAAKIDQGETSGRVIDDNGNTVGAWSLT